MVCSQCGATFTPGMGFCTNCGAAVSTASKAPSTTAPTSSTTTSQTPVAPRAPVAAPPVAAPPVAAPPVAAPPVVAPPVFAAAAPDYGPHADVKAIFSLILGIFAIVPFSVFAGIPAVILGHLAQRDIRNSQGTRTGSGMAMTGVVLGYLSMVILVAVIALPNLMRARMEGGESTPVGSLRTINTAEVTYTTMYPERGYARDLATLGSGPQGCNQTGPDHACLIDSILGAPTCSSGTWCQKQGYLFSVVAICPENLCTNYVVTATPTGRGRRSFCSTSDAVIRQYSGEPLASPMIDPSQCAAWTPLQ